MASLELVQKRRGLLSFIITMFERWVPAGSHTSREWKQSMSKHGSPLTRGIGKIQQNGKNGCFTPMYSGEPPTNPFGDQLGTPHAGS